MHYDTSSQVKPVIHLSYLFFINSFLIYLKKKWYWFSSVFILIAILLVYIFHSIQYYESSVELFFNAAVATKSINEGNLDLKATIRESASLKRVYQIVYSDQMLDRLIEKFELFKIYQINSSPYAKNTLIKKIRKNILINANQYDVVTISVKDANNSQRAADIANFIAGQASELNRYWYAEQLIQRLKVDSMLNSELQNSIKNEKLFFEKNMIDAKVLMANTKGINQTMLDRIYQELNSILINLDQNQIKYSEEFRSNASLLSTMNEKNFSEMIVIKKATPATKTNELKVYFFWSLVVFFSISLSLLLFYCIFQLDKLIRGLKAFENNIRLK